MLLSFLIILFMVVGTWDIIIVMMEVLPGQVLDKQQALQTIIHILLLFTIIRFMQEQETRLLFIVMMEVLPGQV